MNEKRKLRKIGKKHTHFWLQQQKCLVEAEVGDNRDAHANGECIENVQKLWLLKGVVCGEANDANALECQIEDGDGDERQSEHMRWHSQREHHVAVAHIICENKRKN